MQQKRVLNDSIWKLLFYKWYVLVSFPLSRVLNIKRIVLLVIFSGWPYDNDYAHLFKRLELTTISILFTFKTSHPPLFHYDQDTLKLSPIPAWIEMVVYEHKVFMTLVNILLSALRHWLSQRLLRSEPTVCPIWKLPHFRCRKFLNPIKSEIYCNWSHNSFNISKEEFM